ncbi:MAG: branched-chain amino acid ABC transporter permease [Clostridia bacterium]|nr:branched-chain amino acid ABC transporter permease [Clostridia bacterium]
MYISLNTIILFGGVLTVVITVVTLVWKLFKWISGRDKLKEEINQLRDRIKLLEDKHNRDQEGTQNELTIVVYGLLACLKGLSEKGCNGPVTEAIEKIEKHINKQAHNQF